MKTVSKYLLRSIALVIRVLAFILWCLFCPWGTFTIILVIISALFYRGYLFVVDYHDIHGDDNDDVTINFAENLFYQLNPHNDIIKRLMLKCVKPLEIQ